MDRKQILQKIKAMICDDYPTAKIILYGSRARGDYSEYSDWDLLILLNEKINEDRKIEIIDKLFDIELEVNEVFSPIIHNISEWNKLKITPFYHNIQREGVQI